MSSLSSTSSPASSASSINDFNTNSNNNNNTNNSSSSNDIIKVQRQTNKIIITELLPSATVQIEAPDGSKIVSSSNGAINKSAMSSQQFFQQETYNDVLAQTNQFQQSSVSTFQPVKSQAKISASSRSLNLLDKNNNFKDTSTHYIILPDPKIDTKIIDDLLKNNQHLLHYE